MYLWVSSETRTLELTSSRSSMCEMMAASCSPTPASPSCSALSPASTTARLDTYCNTVTWLILTRYPAQQILVLSYCRHYLISAGHVS